MAANKVTVARPYRRRLSIGVRGKTNPRLRPGVFVWETEPAWSLLETLEADTIQASHLLVVRTEGDGQPPSECP